MKKILTILLLLICSVTFGQDIKPIDINFKNLQSPSFSYQIGKRVWIYKGELYGWTELAGWKNVKDTINYYVPYRNAHDTLITSYPIKTTQLILDTTYIHNDEEKKGTIAWDESTQSVETHISNDLHLNNGEELWVPLCLNNSGVNILNGQPVYINSASGTDPTIRLASNITYDESRLIGVATQNIPNGSKGRVTRFGYVNDVDLSGCTSGDNIYLGDKVLTHIRPTGGNFPVTVGKAIVCSTTGRLLVYPQTAEYTSEVNKVDGWPSYLQGEQTNVSFTDINRTLYIAPVSSSYYFYQAGIKYIKNSTQSFQISDVEGLHYIYYDLGIISELVNPSSDQVLNIIRNYVSIAVVYWDAANKMSIYVGNERHTFHWPFWVRAFIHTSFWTQYLSGLGLTNITLGSGSVNADAQFGVDAGSIADEDVISSTSVISSTTGLPIYYRTGANAYWRKTTRAGYSFLNDGTTGLAMYNSFSGGTWSIVSMTNNYYRLVHVFANNNLTDNVFCVSGIAQYASAADAENAINAEVNNIYSGILPFAEMKYIGCLILHTKTGLGNSVNARYVAIPSTGTAYKDFRKSAIQGYGGGGSGSLTFLGLSDTPDSYAGQSNKVVGVSNLETGVEFKPVTIDGITGVINIPSTATYNKGGVPIISQTIDGATTTLTASQKAIKDYADTKEPVFSKGNLSSGTPAITVSNGAGRLYGSATSTVSVSSGYIIPSTVSITSYDSHVINDQDLSLTNELNTSISYDQNTKVLSVVDAGGTKTAIINAGNIVNSFTGTHSVTTTTTTVTFPTAMTYENYPLIFWCRYNKTISGKVILIDNAVYDFTRTVNGFTFSVDTIAGTYFYLATDTTNLFPIAIDNYAPASGSANYIQNQNSSAQNANAWIDGSFKISSGTTNLTLDGNDVGFNRPSAYSYITQGGVGGSLIFLTSNSSVFDTNALRINADGSSVFGNNIQATTAKLTNLTNGKVPYSTVNGLVDSPIYIDGTNVGVGTLSTPSVFTLVSPSSGNVTDFALHWRNSLAFTLGYLGADKDAYGSGALYLYQNDSPNTVISANGNSYLMGGNVGIGTTSPSEKLDLAGNLKLQNGTGFTTANTEFSKITSYAGSANQYEIASIGFRTCDYTNAGAIAFNTANYAGTVERMRINQLGNVGIGYSTGTEITNNKLAVNGGAYFNGNINTTGYQLNGNNLFSSLTPSLSYWNGTNFVGSYPYVVKFDSGTTEGTDLFTFTGTVTKTVDIKAGTNVTIDKTAGAVTINASGGGGVSEIWTSLVGTYSTTTVFTFSGTDKDAKLVEMSLFTCTNSTGATRRIGYVKTATNSSGTIMCNVVTDTDLASGDKDFKVTYNRKVTDYLKLITIPGECIADASYSQGMWYSDVSVASYLLPVDVSVFTAAAGTGAALTFNVYSGASTLFSSAPNMSTNTVLRSQRPSTNTITATSNISLRILSSAGATNKASDFQAKLYVVPQNIYTAF